METILYNRLKSLVTSTLGTEISDLSKLSVMVVEYVEKLAKTQELSGEEKLMMAITYISKLMKDLSGKDLGHETLVLISQFIDRLIEAAKGQLDIQTTSSTPATTTTTATSSTSAAKDSDSDSIKKNKGWFRKA